VQSPDRPTNVKQVAQLSVLNTAVPKQQKCNKVYVVRLCKRKSHCLLCLKNTGGCRYRPVEMWWHTRRNQISSFVRNGRVHLNRPRGGVSSVNYWQPSCAPSAVVMLNTPRSEVVWRVLATHCIPLHFPSRASPCVITYQLVSTYQRVEGIYRLRIHGRIKRIGLGVYVTTENSWVVRRAVGCGYRRCSYSLT